MVTTASAKLPTAPGRNGTCLTTLAIGAAQPEVQAFDPARHLRSLENGSEYLDAKWRLVWFLENHREFSIASNLVHLSARLVVVKVTITLPGGRSAEGLGTASAHDVYRYVETAQTHALARALAMLGFGTESALEFDTDSPADSGVQKNGNGHETEPASKTQPISGSKEPSERLVDNQQRPPLPADPSQAQETLPSWASFEDTETEDRRRGVPESVSNGKHQPAEASDAEAGLLCQDCQGPVKEGRTRQGKVLSPQEVAERSREQTGRVLCPRCLTQALARGPAGGRTKA